jgi:SecD/SecF fusion protein
MWEKNVGQRMLIILGVIVLALVFIRNPKNTLRPGLDIAGGVSLIYEIDDKGMENDPNLAENMKQLLMKRVDPQGVYDLAWRVIGRNRLEIQMPLPPAQAQQLRKDYAEALKDLFSSAITRGEVEDALQQTGADRTAALEKLAQGSEERLTLLNKAAKAYDTYRAALEAYRVGPIQPAETQPATTQPGEAATSEPSSAPASAPASAPVKTKQDLQGELRDAEDGLEDAYDDFLATNIDSDLFQQILELDENSQTRKDSIEQIKEKHPELVDKIDRVLTTYSVWHKNRGYLDGPQDLQRLLRGAGVLEFRILAEPDPSNPTKYDRYRQQLQQRGREPAAGDEYGWFRVDSPMNFFDLKSQMEAENFDPKTSPYYVADKLGKDYYVLARLGTQDGLLADHTWRLVKASMQPDPRGGGLAVHFELDVVGGYKFEQLTRSNIGRPLCILVDNVAYSAPKIQSKIGTQGQITAPGGFSPEKATYLVQTMQAGSLPARLKDTPISERTIGSSLGATNRDMAFRAGVIGVCVVGLFMAGYYLVGGMIADAAMLLNVVLVLAVMAMLQARLSLPGIAGLVLTVGMSVDANVLIFERMREEKERGSSLRLIVKNGYDKAFSVILDSNLTTILTCVIIYYVGSEEIKGFGLTLGWGVAISLFTALFVTRTVFSLLIKYGWLKDITMLKLIGVPKINWYGMRKYFIPASLFVVFVGFGLFLARGKRDYLDVEFQGGVSAEVDVKQGPDLPVLNDRTIRADLRRVGDVIKGDADDLAQATVEQVAGTPNLFRLKVPNVPNDRLAALVTEPLEDKGWLMRDGVDWHTEPDAVLLRASGQTTADEFASFVRDLAPTTRNSGTDIASSSVGSVTEAGFTTEKGRFWNITTTEKNRRLVQYALESALGDRLQRQQRVGYTFVGDAEGRPFPITDRRLDNVIKSPTFPGGTASEPLTNYLGGAAMYFTHLTPAQSVREDVPGGIVDRLRSMRLQPGYQDFPFRRVKVIGIEPAGQDADGETLYSSIAVAVADDHIRYADDPSRWENDLAKKELNLTETALDSEQSLRKVSLFKPQIAQQASEQAIMAVMLSWCMIIGYLWFRFGQARYGIAAVVALVHDVFVAVAALGLAGWIINPPGLIPAGLASILSKIGHGLLIEDFKINMTTVAAVLTIIGYSVNDTIVVFDRIREMRGRLGRVTPQVINDAINQTLSRTILTASTVWMVVLVMYIFGGSSIRGFNYCMLVGTLTGCYSSIAIASPLLLLGVKVEKPRQATERSAVPA